MFSVDTSNYYKYIVCIYYSVLLIGFNELGPVNPIEMVFSIAFLLSASMINAQIFSEIVLLMQSF